MGSPHFGSTHQGTGKSFVLKGISSDKSPYSFLAVHLPHLVGSPHHRLTHQGTVEAFALKQMSSDKLSNIFSAVNLPHFLGLPNFGSTEPLNKEEQVRNEEGQFE